MVSADSAASSRIPKGSPPGGASPSGSSSLPTITFPKCRMAATTRNTASCVQRTPLCEECTTLIPTILIAVR